MKQEDIDLLKVNGWSVDCESPFELSKTNGSTATLSGARDVLAYYKLLDKKAKAKQLKREQNVSKVG